MHDFWGQVFAQARWYGTKALRATVPVCRCCKTYAPKAVHICRTHLWFSESRSPAIASGPQSGYSFHPSPDAHSRRIFGVNSREVEQEAPSTCQVAAAKWGDRCGARIVASHLCQRGFEALPQCARLEAFLQATQPLPPAALGDWLRQPSAFLSAPRMSSVSIILNEILLPIAQRAGTGAVAVPRAPTEAPSILQAVLPSSQRAWRREKELSLCVIPSQWPTALMQREGRACHQCCAHGLRICPRQAFQCPVQSCWFKQSVHGSARSTTKSTLTKKRQTVYKQKGMRFGKQSVHFQQRSMHFRPKRRHFLCKSAKCIGFLPRAPFAKVPAFC